MDPACEVNEKSTREKNDRNEALEEGTSPPLDLDASEKIEADEETLPYADRRFLFPTRKFLYIGKSIHGIRSPKKTYHLKLTIQNLVS